MTVNSVSLATSLVSQLGTTPPAAPSGSGASFASLIDRLAGSAAESHGAAESAVRDLALGRTENLHGVMMQVAQADLSFRLILEIRNRLTEAYQDIMKMQV